MPRLTNAEFLKRHHFLAELWEYELLRVFFTILEPMAQWDIHQYYQTTNHGSDADIIETRTTVNAGDKALPQKAGRAYQEIEAIFFQEVRYFNISHDPDNYIPAVRALHKVRLKLRNQKPVKTVRRGPMKRGRHTVRALVKPNIDFDKLARVYVMLALEIQKETRENGGVLPDKWKYLEKMREQREKRE